MRQHETLRAFFKDLDILQQALELVEDQPHSQTQARALRKLGNLSIDLGDTQSARALYEESLAIEQAAGNGVGIASGEGL